MPLTPAQLDSAFAMLETAASLGERCPQSPPFGPIQSTACGALARAGRIRVEIFMHNWRVVTILEGPHKGKHTARCPYPNAKRPYKVIDKDSAPTPGQRQQPWSPTLSSTRGTT